MLANNFLSNTDLEITEEQRLALIRTLVLLETNKLTHTTYDDDSWEFVDVDESDEFGFTGHFSMEHWIEPATCGTIACIGGTAALISGNLALFDDYGKREGLMDLFSPICDMDYDDIKPWQAARALRNYLTTGDSDWGSVLVAP